MSSRIITDAEFTSTAIRIAEEAVHELLLAQYLLIIDQCDSRPVPRIAAALMAAAMRQVRIRILLNRFSHGHGRYNRRAKRPPELDHPNIDLRYHTQGQVLHSKIIVADKTTSLIGSHNLTHWGITRSHNLSILTVDTNVASGLLSLLDPLFERATRA